MNLAEGPPIDGIEAKAALAPRPSQAGLSEGSEVLRDGRLGHSEPAGHLPHGELLHRQEIQHRPPDRLGQRSEGSIRLDLGGHGDG
jgi:hypothetical protein